MPNPFSKAKDTYDMVKKARALQKELKETEILASSSDETITVVFNGEQRIVDITIDEWPFLEPFVEIEGNSEKAVKEVFEKLGFNYTDALFCTVGKLYEMKYHISPDAINTLEKLVFEMENPFQFLIDLDTGMC